MARNYPQSAHLNTDAAHNIRTRRKDGTGNTRISEVGYTNFYDIPAAIRKDPWDDESWNSPMRCES